MRVLTIFLVISLNWLVSTYYTSGDQQYYHEIYNELAALNMIEGYLFYIKTINSQEFLHYLISWIGSNLHLDKNFYYSLCSGVLAYFFLLLCEKHNVSSWVASAIVLSNFYFMVLYFAAERLKISFIFFFASIYYLPKLRWFVLNLLLSIFSHVQMAIIYGCIAFAKFFETIFSGKLSKSGIIYILLLMAPVGYYSDFIWSKFLFYNYNSSNNNAIELLRIASFSLMAAYYSTNKKQTLLVFIPLYIAVLLIGGDRINMLGYFLFLYYGLRYNSGKNVGILLTSVYFGLTSFQFLFNIFLRADGFDFGQI